MTDEKAIDGGLTISQMGEFIRWIQTHTALGRLQFDECWKAFEAAKRAGYLITKPETAA